MRGNEQSRIQRLGADPQTGVRSRLPRKRAPSGTGRRALDRAVWPLHTPRNTRPVPGYRQETRDRQIAAPPAENCIPRTKGVIATIDRVSLPYIPRMDRFVDRFWTLSFFFFFLSWKSELLKGGWLSWKVSCQGGRKFRFDSLFIRDKGRKEFGADEFSV